MSFLEGMVQLIGFLVGSAGLAVTLGWFADNMSIIRTPFGFMPMRFAVSISFFALGVVILAINKDKWRFARILAVSILAVFATGVASWIPAMRASRIDPLAALSS